MLRNLKEFKPQEIEEKVLKFWKENQILDKALKFRKKNRPFRFFEGPPTANGRPGIHHVLSRAFKDIILRYKTMRGFFVRRKAGWDTHGLPVEIEVEKELGLKNKQEIEKFGIMEFNEAAKSSVWKYKDEWEKLTDRIGFWLDLKNPYVTYFPQYIESLWWVFKEIAKRGFLKQSFKIVPWCPRCQTSLSSHELGQPGVYQKTKDPSIYVKFEIQNPKSGKGKKEHLLIWTTTPWTLPSNVAVAVNPRLTYTKYQIGKDLVWSFSPPPLPAGASTKEGGEIEVVEKISGRKLVGLRYKPLFSVSGPWLKNKKFFRVYPADFVSTEEGTGLVHIAPAFGEDDMNLIKQYEKDLVGKIPITIDEKGLVQKACLSAGKDLPGAGKFVKTADKEIIKELERRGVLLKSDVIEHEYPFCWRCGTPLLYLSRFSWFIEMSRLKKELLANNEKINWIPDNIKEGRFGEWLKEIKDWAISRDRYWGTPLPIWECSRCDNREVAGSLEDLDDLRFSRNNFFILRHGEADHNVRNVIAAGPEKGKNISRLTATGVKQIEAAAQDFKKQLGEKKLDVIFVSPYFRTQQTAKIAAKILKAKIITDKRLEEINTGAFNWRAVDDYRKFFANNSERFTKASAEGETLTEVKKRMLAAILDINSKYQDKNILIVSHGDPLWMLEAALRGVADEKTFDMEYIEVDGRVKKVELHNWPYNLITASLDLHRPYIDRIYLKCQKCRSKMIRIKEVADVWFDSGAMPFAQDHYPFSGAGMEFPADYISEGIDQTRGWFYTMLAVATVLGMKTPPYLNVIALGLVLDKNGQKMSKSKGNVVSPWDVMQKYGADAVRWYFYTVNPPAESKRFDELELGKVLRKVFHIIYNSFVFLDTYGAKASSIKHQASSNVLDRWIWSRLNQVIKLVTEHLEKYEVGEAGRLMEGFVDDLSRWYIRRSRRRFQKPDDQNDLESASAVLRHCLLALSKLFAPFTPFFSEALYQSLSGNSELSVHLEDWPKADDKDLDLELLVKMEEIRRLASLALALRADKGIKVRQPLASLEIQSKKLTARDEELLDILKDEINVKEIKFNFQMKEEINFDLNITPELREEGLVREFVRLVQGLRQDANLVPKDRIAVMVEAEAKLGAILSKYEALIKREVGAQALELKKSDKFDAELNSKVDDQPIWIGLKKV